MSQSLSPYQSAAVQRAASRAADYEHAKADQALNRLVTVAETTNAAFAAILSNTATRAAVELARPEASAYCDLIMTEAALAYRGIVADVGRRR